MKRVIILAALAFAMLTGTVGIAVLPSTQTMASPDDSCSGCEDGCGACERQPWMRLPQGALMFHSLRPGAQIEHLWLAVLMTALIGTAGLFLLAIAH